MRTKLVLLAGVLLFAFSFPLHAAFIAAENEESLEDMLPPMKGQPSPVESSSQTPRATFQGQSASEIVAVADFENYSKFQSLESLSKGIPDAIINQLQGLEGISLVERTRFDAIMKELQLGMSGLMNDITVQKVGRSLAAGKMIVGGFEYNPVTKNIRINARIVEIETGLIIFSDSVIDKETYADDLQKAIARKIALFFIRKYGIRNSAPTTMPSAGFSETASEKNEARPVFSSLRQLAASFDPFERPVAPAKKAGDPSLRKFIPSLSK
jgi:TolB-like protein